MKNKKMLVIGATGLVGSQTTINLAEKGYDVTAMVRKKGAKIKAPYTGTIKYVVGDLSDENSVIRAVQGMDVVISSANGVIPERKKDTAGNVNTQATRLVEICEKAGVQRFVQSSVPVYQYQHQVAELHGKRAIENALFASKMQAVIIRNPAFMDVWLVMCGFQQAENKSPHATTKRNYGFLKMWRSLVGDFVVKRGWFIAPGGKNYGSPLIASRDVANMMANGAIYEGSEDLIVESGGEKWLTWQEVSEIVAKKIGRKKLTIIPMPGWLAQLNQIIVSPFSPAAANVMGLIRLVATHQPKYDAKTAIQKLNLPQMWSLEDYLEEHLSKN